MTDDLSMVRTGSIQQQQGMPGGRSINYDKLLVGLANHTRQRVVDRDFFGAWRP